MYEKRRAAGVARGAAHPREAVATGTNDNYRMAEVRKHLWSLQSKSSRTSCGPFGWVHALPFFYNGPEAMDILGAKPKRATEQDRIVGPRIAALRKARGLSQIALGRAVGVSFHQIQKYENGMNRVGASRLSDIARVLEVPVSTFFNSDDGGAEQEQAEVFGFLRTRLHGPGRPG